MLSRDYRDILGGLVLTLLGLWVAWYAAQNYSLGTLRRMGEGMVPMWLGIILAVFGVMIALPAVFRAGPKIHVNFVPALFILAGVSSFALMVRPFGLFPSIFAVVILSSLADTRFRPLAVLLLGAFLCAMVWLIFRVGLGQPFPLLRWPF